MMKPETREYRDKVLDKYPQAYSERFIAVRGITTDVYNWYIFDNPVNMVFIGYGHTEYEAWKNAFNKLNV